MTDLAGDTTPAARSRVVTWSGAVAERATALRALLVVGLAAALAVGLAGLVAPAVDAGGRVDRWLAAWAVGERGPALDAVFGAVTELGSSRVALAIVAVAAGVLALRRRSGLALALVLASAGSSTVTAVLKDLIDRDRPPMADRLVEASGYAFPSGHSSQAVAAYGALALVALVVTTRPAVRRTVVAAAGAIIVLVGLSRVYLGVHWASDVVAGWAVGAAWLGTTFALVTSLGPVGRADRRTSSPVPPADRPPVGRPDHRTSSPVPPADRPPVGGAGRRAGTSAPLVGRRPGDQRSTSG